MLKLALGGTDSNIATQARGGNGSGAKSRGLRVLEVAAHRGPGAGAKGFWEAFRAQAALEEAMKENRKLVQARVHVFW